MDAMQLHFGLQQPTQWQSATPPPHEYIDSNALSVARIALAHHRLRLERRRGNVADVERLVVRLVGGDHRRVRGKHEVDARVGHQVGLHTRDNMASVRLTERAGTAPSCTHVAWDAF